MPPSSPSYTSMSSSTDSQDSDLEFPTLTQLFNSSRPSTARLTKPSQTTPTEALSPPPLTPVLSFPLHHTLATARLTTDSSTTSDHSTSPAVIAHVTTRTPQRRHRLRANECQLPARPLPAGTSSSTAQPSLSQPPAPSFPLHISVSTSSSSTASSCGNAQPPPIASPSARAPTTIDRRKSGGRDCLNTAVINLDSSDDEDHAGSCPGPRSISQHRSASPPVRLKKMGGRRIVLSDSDSTPSHHETESSSLSLPGRPLSNASFPTTLDSDDEVESLLLTFSPSSVTTPSPPRRPSSPDAVHQDDSILSWSPPPRRPLDLPPMHKPARAPRNRGSVVLPVLDTLSLPTAAVPKPTPRRRIKSVASIVTVPTTAQRPLNLNSKAWKLRREKLSLDLIAELDEKLFCSRLSGPLGLKGGERSLTTDIPGVEAEEKGLVQRGVHWTGRLRTTAGMSRWCRKRKTAQTVMPDREDGDTEEWEHFCRIELSSKVLASDESVLATTAHELCHIAVWVFHGKDAAPHGKEFKAMAKKVMRIRGDISVTTKHDFEITKKYTWACASCPATYGRDSKSIDITKQCCGRCKGRLVPQFPDSSINLVNPEDMTRSNVQGSEVSSSTPAKSNAYRDFVKSNFAQVKLDAPSGSSHQDVMVALATRWRSEKERRAAAVVDTAAEQEDGSKREAQGARGLVRELEGLSVNDGTSD